MARLCDELLSHFRTLMLIKSVKNPRDNEIMADDEFEQAQTQSDYLSLADIVYYMDVLSKAYQNMSGKSLEGDPVEEVKEYWNNLVEIASPNIAKEENNQIALLIYRNVTSQIYTKYYWFIKNSLATAKDISNELDNIEKYVNEIKVAVPDDEELQILVNECLDNIENTRSLDNSGVK